MSLDLGVFIERHLHASKAINGKYLKYTTDELYELCKISIETFQKEPPLVRINPPCVIVGDIHGQYYDLLRMFSAYKTGDLSGALSVKYLFVGDYVDRGRHSLECVCLVLALKNHLPKKYQVLRGNHETVVINRVYGFLDELNDRFGPTEGFKLWETFNDVFAWMPLAGLVGSKILCMHGGIGPDLRTFEDIEQIPRPLPDAATVPLALDLLWADPVTNMTGFRPNTVRGVSVFFGEEEVKRLCKDLNINLIVRGHQMMTSGFGYFADRRLMTIFTAPRYQQDNPNSGATLLVDVEGHAILKILRPTGEGGGEGAEDTPKSDSGSCFFGKEQEGEKNKRSKASKSTGSTSTGSKAGVKKRPKK